ncbi:hypothetical protein R4Z09_12305 [Niallia oryzisoli]|uniref:Uncharacterized protein n=1 Tax=Niallia oryzisoli TaxID=1737571 RepID=A0ABZ2CP73_9BACI
MGTNLKAKVRFILNEVNVNGLVWKKGKDLKHLKTRKEYGHIPNDFSMSDYEDVIMKIMNEKENDVFLYYLKGYQKIISYLTMENGL